MRWVQLRPAGSFCAAINNSLGGILLADPTPSLINRRRFSQTTLAAVALAGTAQGATPQGANDRIRVGVVGVANRGLQVIDGFRAHEDCEVVALCDIDQRILAKAVKHVGGSPQTYTDFREMIDKAEIDAVAVATPDHWHAIQTITACDAGKDVYVEKPLSVTVVEGRRMVEAARRNDRVVQVGTHRRSSETYTELAERSQRGDFGKICVARAYRLSNMNPNGIGRKEPQSPPPGFDWDTWLGPRPDRPYQDNIHPYKFRWWHEFSSQMGNWGVHYLDAIRWCMGEEAPKSVCAMGGKFSVDDDRTIPDTMEVCFEFASGRLAIFGQYESSGNPVLIDGEIELRGTDGTVYVGESGYKVVSERPGQFANRRQPRAQPEQVEKEESNALNTANHVRNFLDCIRSREKPTADVEIGHRSTTFSLIANISQQVGMRLEWDAENERFTNSDEANKLLHYDYREPWKLG